MLPLDETQSPIDGLANNEARADVGELALWAVADALPGQALVPLVGTIEDTLVYVAHACDRYGIPAGEAFSHALRRYRTVHLGSITPAARRFVDVTQPIFNVVRRKG